MEDRSELEAVGIQIILSAGDAHTATEKAFQCALQGDDNAAQEYLEEAKNCINKAHRAQSEIIQKEADGAEYPFSLLFSHAQDTMMTNDLERRTVGKLIEMMKVLDVE